MHPLPTDEVAQGLLSVNPPPDLAAPLGLARGAGVWGYVGPSTGAPTETSTPPTPCAIYGQGLVLGVNNYASAIEFADADVTNSAIVGYGNTHGVYGFASGGEAGVAGTSASGPGVEGTGTIGVKGTGTGSGSVYGIWGQTAVAGGAGVAGLNNSTGQNGSGVFGQSTNYDGVHGVSQSSQHAGVSGVNTSGGYGIYGAGTTAGYFSGDVTITGNLAMGGTVTVASSGDVVLNDVAEHFEFTDGEAGPGTVMALDQNGRLQPCTQAYDKRVAGVVSGAGNFRPAVILGERERSNDRMTVALVGKVYCKVDAGESPIEVGDLLTTSDTPGFAMKASDASKAFGAVIGKALKPLSSGQSMIPILVALQ
jgi:hypothetical protein